MSDTQVIRDRIAVVPDGCWLWLLAVDKDGYGRLKVHGRRWRAHRFAYVAFRGPIPDDLPLDHVVCDQPTCVNPWHVEARTMQQNTLRSLVARAAVNARKLRCSKGHEFTPENTYLLSRKGRTERRCRECHRAKCRRQYLRRKAA